MEGTSSAQGPRGPASCRQRTCQTCLLRLAPPSSVPGLLLRPLPLAPRILPPPPTPVLAPSHTALPSCFVLADTSSFCLQGWHQLPQATASKQIMATSRQERH